MKARRRRSAGRTNGPWVERSTAARWNAPPRPCLASTTFVAWPRPARTLPTTDAAWRLRNGRRVRTEWGWRSRSRPIDSCITWCASSSAPWLISRSAGARRQISPVCLQRPIIWRPVRLPRLRACTWKRCAVRRLAADGIRTNVTLCFSSVQCLIAAKAGASYVSPFIGRLDDVGQEGMDVIREARAIFDNYNIETEILAASIRHPRHVVEAAMIGADVATLPPDVLKKLLLHPLTDRGLDQFLADWSKLVARAKAAV